MIIEVISMWYNEEFLAPLFLSHYAFADKITILFDTDTTDGTLTILKANPKVIVLPVNSGDQMNDVFKRDVINDAWKASVADWVVTVDADEFVFPSSHDYDLRQYLIGRENKPENILKVHFCAVYRHITDVDIDRSKPPLLQRRHGIREGVPGYAAQYIKPSVTKPKSHYGWQYGIHYLMPNELSRFEDSETLLGSHWYLADPVFAVKRQLQDRKNRQGKINIGNGLTAPRYVSRTETDILEEARKHSEDPQLF